MNKNEAFSRVLIDAQLAALGWDVQDPNSVRFEVVLNDGTHADYSLYDHHGRALAVIEAKRYSINSVDAAKAQEAFDTPLASVFAGRPHLTSNT